jgi:hypothetical protein
VNDLILAPGTRPNTFRQFWNRVLYDSPLEEAGFEPSVPREGNYAHETAPLPPRHFPSLPRPPPHPIWNRTERLIAEGRCQPGDDTGDGFGGTPSGDFGSFAKRRNAHTERDTAR